MSNIGEPYIPPPDPRPETERYAARLNGQALRKKRLALGIGMRQACGLLGITIVELCAVERGVPHTVPEGIMRHWNYSVWWKS